MKKLFVAPGVKKFLKGSQNGSEWTGSEKTQTLMKENFEIFSKYKDLLIKK